MDGVVIPEDPAKAESQSNGRVEEAGKTVREHTTVFKEQLEDKASIKLKSDSVIVLWMIRWAAIVCTKYNVGKDGKTPHERKGGRRCKLKVIPFGEKGVVPRAQTDGSR